MKFLRSRHFSLFCAIFNTTFAINAFVSGSLGIGLICSVFAVFCLSNYLRASKK